IRGLVASTSGMALARRHRDDAVATRQVRIEGNHPVWEGLARETDHISTLIPANFHDETPDRGQLRWHLQQESTYQVKPVRTPVEGEARLATDLRSGAVDLGAGHVRQVGDDEVERAVQAFQEIALDQADSGGYPVASDVIMRHCERLDRAVHSVHD